MPASDPPGDGPRSIAQAHAVDKTNQDTAIDKDTVLLRDLAFIFSSVSSELEYDFAASRETIRKVSIRTD